MQLDRCTNLGCTKPPTFLFVREQDNIAIGGFCDEHQNQDRVPGYRVERIPNPKEHYPPMKTANSPIGFSCGPSGSILTSPSASVVPLTAGTSNFPIPTNSPQSTFPVPGQPPAITSTATAPPSAMAPADAVSDFDDDIIPPIVSTEEASSNFMWRFGKNDAVFYVQTTIRGCINQHQIGSHLDSIVNAMKIVLDRGGLPRDSQAPTQKPVTAGVPVTAPAAPTGPGVAPAPAAAPTAGAEAPAQSGHFLAVRIKAVPQEGGITELQFFESGKKFPTQYLKRTPEEHAAGLSKTAAWTPAHFVGPASYELNPPIKVSWQESEKRNANNKRYKNIVDISPA